MAQYHILDPEDLIECPYDRLHMVRAKRFPYHLMKCRKNYIGNDYAVCPFNARHEMPKPELRYHMANCKDKAVLEQDIRYAQEREEDDGTYFKGNTSVPSYYGDWVPPEPAENWDAEMPVIPSITFSSKEQTEKPFKDTAGMTPSQKKSYYERLKLNYERKRQGLPPLDENESTDDKQDTRQTGSGLRMPLNRPQVLQDAPPSEKKQINKPQQSQVFAYSLSKAGIGRGQINTDLNPTENMRKPRIAANIFHSQDNIDTNISQKPRGVNNLEKNENAALLCALARGRGVGRGIPVVNGGIGGLRLRNEKLKSESISSDTSEEETLNRKVGMYKLPKES